MSEQTVLEAQLAIFFKYMDASFFCVLILLLRNESEGRGAIRFQKNIQLKFSVLKQDSFLINFVYIMSCFYFLNEMFFLLILDYDINLNFLNENTCETYTIAMHIKKHY